MADPEEVCSEEYCIVESLRDYELLSSQIHEYRDKESSAEQERQRLEERTRQLQAENSRLRTQVGQQRLDVQELEAELKVTPVEEELRLELAQQQEYIRTLETRLQGRSLEQGMAASAPAEPPRPPTVTNPWSEGIAHRVLYANPKRWKSA